MVTDDAYLAETQGAESRPKAAAPSPGRGPSLSRLVKSDQASVLSRIADMSQRALPDPICRMEKTRPGDGPALFCSAFAEDPFKDRVNVFGVITHVELFLDLLFSQGGNDIRRRQAVLL